MGRLVELVEVTHQLSPFVSLSGPPPPQVEMAGYSPPPLQIYWELPSSNSAGVAPVVEWGGVGCGSLAEKEPG